MARRRAGTQDAERIGVREVAQHAAVSTQTVSRVINGSPNVREETRRRVRAAIEQLGYRPNNAARALGTSRTRTLGVIVSDITLHGPSAAVAALARATRESGRWLATAYADGNDPASVTSAVDHLLGQGVDGLVLVAPHALGRDALLAMRPDVPIVLMHAGRIDRQAEAAALLVDHLVQRGHRHVARLGGPEDWLEESSRRAGFHQALARHGLTPGPQWVGDWSAQAGAAIGPLAARTVRARGGPTAIVVANDQMALGLMTALRAAGLTLPADVSIVGFDDNPDAAHYDPPLTTVRLDLAGEARRCVAAAFGPGEGEDTTPAPPTLVVRSSTAARKR